MIAWPTLLGGLLNNSVQYFPLVLYLAPCVNVPPSVSSKHIIQFDWCGWCMNVSGMQKWNSFFCLSKTAE